MLSFTTLHGDLYNHYQLNSQDERYLKLAYHHRQNACATFSSDKMIYEIVKLIENIDSKRGPFSDEKNPEDHPAIRRLCDFWNEILGFTNMRQPGIPLIQLFLGKDDYVPLIDMQTMPVNLERNEQLGKRINSSSMAFGSHFLVTFLASRKDAEYNAYNDCLNYLTVGGDGLLQEPLSLSGGDALKVNIKKQLAWRVLEGLRNFPYDFPILWSYLEEKHGKHHKNFNLHEEEFDDNDF